MKISLKPDRETVFRLLRDSEINKKLKVFSKLGELSEADRIKILLKILENGSWVLRERSARELAAIGSRVVPRLVKLCQKGFWFSRAAACLSLGEIGDVKALAPLAGLVLAEENPTVVKEARAAMVKLLKKDPSAAVLLVPREERDRNKLLSMIREDAPEIFDAVSSRMRPPKPET